MIKQIILTAVLTGLITTGIVAQNFNKEMKQQQSNIEAAYRKKKITEKEYSKLKEEQDVIKFALEKYNSDGTLTPAEKNRIASKLQRAANRLRRYQTNNERY